MSSIGDNSDVNVGCVFRQAEKKYKLHYENVIKVNSKGRRRGGKLRERPIDLSEVMDLTTLPADDQSVQCFEMDPQRNVYVFRKHRGLYVVPNALTLEEKVELIRNCFCTYCEPPATTNHTTTYGLFQNIWKAAQQGLVLQFANQDGNKYHWFNVADGRKQVMTEFRQTLPQQSSNVPSQSQKQIIYYPLSQQICQKQEIEAGKLLQKLRWVCLGPQFDWNSRCYTVESPYAALPQEIQQLGATIIQQISQLYAKTNNSELFACLRKYLNSAYVPDAALVNYYYQGDMLGGHIDDAEHNMDEPIVSISLGCPAIFLIGGFERNVDPSAIFLRSGDIVVMAGESRRCYHGIPRILTGEQWCKEWEVQSFENMTDQAAIFLDYMQTCRINISVRKTGL